MSRRIYDYDDPRHERHQQLAPPPQPEAAARAVVTIEVVALDFRAAVDSVDAGDRTVSVTWSTGAGVLRTDWTGVQYLEVLSLDPKHVRLERLNSGAPVLNSHNAGSLSQVIGVVVEGSARLVGPADARAKLRFSRRADVEPIFQDIKDKILTSLSVGYRVHAVIETRGADKSLIRTAIDWEPFEISLVAMPADSGAKIRAGAVLNSCRVLSRDEASETEHTINERLAQSRFAHLIPEAADHHRWLRLAKARYPQP